MHSRSTVNYQLPQFNGSDKPTWLGDINGAFLAIDTTMHDNAQAASDAQESATSALAGLTTALERAQTADTKATQAISDAAAAQLTANGAAANALEALTGVGNINEILANRAVYHYSVPFTVNVAQDPGYFDIPDYTWAEADAADLILVRFYGGAIHAMYIQQTGKEDAIAHQTEVYTTHIEDFTRRVNVAQHNDLVCVQINACNRRDYTYGDSEAVTTVDNAHLQLTDVYIIKAVAFETI